MQNKDENGRAEQHHQDVGRLEPGHATEKVALRSTRSFPNRNEFANGIPRMNPLMTKNRGTPRPPFPIAVTTGFGRDASTVPARVCAEMWYRTTEAIAINRNPSISGTYRPEVVILRNLDVTVRARTADRPTSRFPSTFRGDVSIQCLQHSRFPIIEMTLVFAVRSGRHSVT